MLVAPSGGSYWPQFLIVGEFAGAEMKICRGSPEIVKLKGKQDVFVMSLEQQFFENCDFNPFPKQALVFTCLQFKSFENTVGKGEIARNKQFLHFP